MSLLEDWEKLNRIVEEAERKKSRAEGALEQMEARLKSEFGLGLKDVEKELTGLEKEGNKLEKEFAPKLSAFLQKYEDKL